MLRDRLYQEDDNLGADGSGDGGDPGGGGFEPPPPIEPEPPPIIPLPPIEPPVDPFPSQPPPTEPPPYPPAEPPTEPTSEPTPPSATSGSPPVYQPVPGEPGSPNNPITVTGTGHYPSPPPVGPVVPQPPPVSVTNTSTQGGPGASATAIANASINQSINIVNQDVSPLAQAVQQAITDAVQKQSDIAIAATNQISTAINGYSNSFFGWVRSLGAWLQDNIGNVLHTIVTGVEKVAATIYAAVKDAFGTISTLITQTIVPVLEKIGNAVKSISDFYSQHIQPILATISTIQRTISTAIVAIEKDIQGGLQGILKLPTDLANAFSTIDQALIRAGIALRVHKADDADFYFVTDDGKGFADHIKSLGAAVSGLAAKKQQTTYAPGHEQLSEPTLAEVLPELLESMNEILGDTIKGIGNLAKKPWLGAEAIGIAGLGIFAELFEPMEILFLLFEILKTPLETIGEVAAERVREKTQLTKLDASTLTAAWRRSFIESKDMDEELATQGYNKNRAELFRRLSTFQEDVSSLVDYLYRGIIDDADFSSGLKGLGYTDQQVSAVREASTRLLDVTTAIQAWRRGDLTEEQVDQTLTVNRFNDADRVLIKGLAFAPRTYGSAYGEYLQKRMLNALNFAVPDFTTIPHDVVTAGKADGLSDDAILAQWTATVNTLPSEAWLNLYWRGQASQEELRNALFRDRVPEQLWANWIDSQRPLIPFRTVPGMISAGIMTEAEGLDYLQKHGYSLTDSVLLLKYATRGGKAAKATVAAAQHGLSLTSAKTAYEDGLLTDDQYMTLLKAHGLDDNAAALDLKMVKVLQETKVRKQIGIDLVNEYQAGLIDQQTAVQQLAASGYTVAEQAAVHRKLKSAKSDKAKTPSEAEVRAMAKHDVITVQDYYDTLVTIGYSSTWAQRFRDLYFPVDTSTPFPAPAG